MIARISKALSKKDGDKGFTLIELLVVIIIIGILSAIAIPVFMNQRKKAEDSAARADVSTIGKEIATYYVDHADTANLAVAASTATPPRYVMTGGDIPTAGNDLGKASNNVVLDTQNLASSTDWCVSVKNPKGDKAVAGFKYSAQGGLEEGVCATTP